MRSQLKCYTPVPLPTVACEEGFQFIIPGWHPDVFPICSYREVPRMIDYIKENSASCAHPYCLLIRQVWVLREPTEGKQKKQCAYVARPDQIVILNEEKKSNEVKK